MSRKLSILVLNVTGTVANKVTEALNEINQFNLKGAIRSPQSDKAKQIIKLNRNLTIVQILTDNDFSIEEVLKDVTRLVFLTPLSDGDAYFIKRTLIIARSSLDLVM